MQDKFEDLRTFVAVAQARSFAAAGRQLGIAKSAISRRVQELEGRLGTRLINRSTRSVSLTESGRVFFENATELLAGLEEAEGQASRGAAQTVGSLRILAPRTFGHMHLVPLVCAFLEQHNRLSIELMLSDAPVDLLAAGCDMAVRIGELRDPTLSARQLGTIRKVACAAEPLVRRVSFAQARRHQGARLRRASGRQMLAQPVLGPRRVRQFRSKPRGAAVGRGGPGAEAAAPPVTPEQ